MAKLRHAIVKPPSWIEITSDDLVRLQHAGKCNLDDGDAKELEKIVNGYMKMTDLEEKRANSRDAERYLQKLQTKTKALIKDIEDVFFQHPKLGLSDNRFTAKYMVLHEVFVDRKSNGEFLGQLHLFNSACEKARETFQDAKLSSAKGRRQSEWLVRLFNDVGRIYEAAGGTATAYWSEHDRNDDTGGQEGSAFTEFTWELLTHCHKQFRPKTKRALAASVIRWRKDRLAAQKRTAD